MHTNEPRRFNQLAAQLRRLPGKIRVWFGLELFYLFRNIKPPTAFCDFRTIFVIRYKIISANLLKLVVQFQAIKQRTL